MSINLCEAMDINHGRISLIAEPTDQTLALITAGQEYDVALTMSAARVAEAEKFTFSAGTTTYTGSFPLECQFVGDAVLSSDKSARVTLTSYVNGVATTATDFDFQNAGDQGSFSSNSIYNLPAGDEILVKAKSDTANTTITFKSYKVQYSGYQICD
jgi:hypothetical protein